jgi:hypothetical protein
MNAHVDGRQTGAALQPLSAKQIHVLVMLAREAWGRCAGAQGFDEWRHQQCLMAVERGGLTQCRNEDFLPLQAHFLRLLGRDQEAAAAETRHEMEPRTWALHSFQAAVQESTDAAFAAGVQFDAYAYASGYLRKARGVATFDEADAKAVWAATYLLKRKAALMRKRAGSAMATPQEVPF